MLGCGGNNRNCGGMWWTESCGGNDKNYGDISNTYCFVDYFESVIEMTIMGFKVLEDNESRQVSNKIYIFFIK